jgi:hypothetical protein
MADTAAIERTILVMFFPTLVDIKFSAQRVFRNRVMGYGLTRRED